MGATERLTGRVKHWNANRAFGFIATDTGADYFAHISQIQGDYEPLKNDQVEFTPDVGRDGRTFARSIVILKGDSE
jgi:cold shock CspA family protein